MHSDGLRSSSRIHLAGWAIVLAITYAGLSRAVTVVTAFGGSSGTTFWPAAGVTIAVLLRRPRREWGWFLAAVAAAEFALNFWVSHLPFDVSVGWAVANAVEPLVGATLLLRGGRAAPRLTRSEDLGRFVVFAVLVGPFVGALVGAGSATVLDFYSLWPALPRWYVGDAVGALVLGPMVLALLSPGERVSRVGWRALSAWLLALSALVIVVLTPSDLPWGPALPFLILPLPALIAFVSGPLGAAIATAIVALGVNGMTAAGYGPFSLPDEIAGLVEAQAFVAMTAMTTLVVSALRSDLLSRAELDLLKSVYLQTVAHDIRTPLTVISGLAEVLDADWTAFSEAERSDLLQRIRTRCRGLDDMVTELLASHRLDATAPQRRPTEVRRLIAAAIDRVEPAGHSIEQSGGRFTAVIDPTEVERMVENLVANAVRHTPAGTRIQVAASLDADGLLIQVDDSGPGVPDDLKEQIFKPFVQVDKDGSGTGLGLSLVAQFAQRHGGRAWVEDREGGGASFRVLLTDT